MVLALRQRFRVDRALRRAARLCAPLALCALAVSLNQAHAAGIGGGVETLKVKRACLYYTYVPGPQRRHWRKSGERLTIGEKLVGKIVIRRNKLVLFKRDGRIQATHFDCFEGPEDRVTWSAIKGYATFGVLSWQETYSIQTPSAQTVSLLSNAAGACAGGGAEIRHGRWDLNLSGCLSYGKAQVSVNDEEANGFAFDVRNANVFTFMVSPAALWRPLSQNVALGFNAPLVLRISQVPVPAGGYQLKSPVSFFPSLLFEARLERLPVAISQKLGFYRSLSRFLWLIELQYHFQ